MTPKKRSDRGDESGERPRQRSEVERSDKQWRVMDLAATSSTHEPPEPGVVRLPLLRGLLLKNPERREITLLGKDLLDPRDTERPNQLVLEIGIADEEVLVLQIADGGGVPHTDRIESFVEETHLGQIAQPGYPYVQPGRTVAPEKMTDVSRSVHRKNGNAFGPQITIAPRRQCHHRTLIADSFDENHRRGIDRLLCRHGRDCSRWDVPATSELALRSA